MAIVTRLTEQNDGQDVPVDQDVFEHEYEIDDQEGELEDGQPPLKTDGRIKPKEVRNPWGRKGKPKKAKTFEEMKVEALAKLVDVPQRDGSIKQMPLAFYFFESMIAAACKGTVYQRLAVLRALEKDGDLARLDGHLQEPWEEAERRRLEELYRRIDEIEQRFLPTEQE